MNVIICSPFGQNVPGGTYTTWQRLKMWMLLKSDDNVSQRHQPLHLLVQVLITQAGQRNRAVMCLWTRLLSQAW